MPGNRRHHCRDAGIARRVGEDERAGAASRLECTMHPAQAFERVRVEHQPEAADHGIEDARKVQSLAVEPPDVDIEVAGTARVLFREFQDRERDVGREDAAAGTDALRDVEGLVAGARRDVEHASAGPDLGAIEHGVGRLAQPAPDLLAVVVPALRREVPLLPHARLERFGSGRRAGHGPSRC